MINLTLINGLKIFHKAFLLFYSMQVKTYLKCLKILSCELFRQLDDASRSVFKENVRLNEALKYHIKEAEDLQKLTNSLAKENASLALDKVCLTHRTANSSVTIRHRQSVDRDHSSP